METALGKDSNLAKTQRPAMARHATADAGEAAEPALA